RFVHADSVLDGPGVLAEPSADRLGEPIGKEMHVRIDDHEDLPFADSRMSALPIRSGGDGCLGVAHRTRTADLTRCALRNSSVQALGRHRIACGRPRARAAQPTVTLPA